MMATSEINQAAVEHFFAGQNSQATIQQIRVVLKRLMPMAVESSHYGTRPTHNGQKLNPETIQEVCNRMVALLQERGATCFHCGYGWMDKTDVCEHD